MGNVVVIGAGAMGLAAAHKAAQDGHKVTVLETRPEPGGMAAHFDFEGLSLEAFYHFIAKTDEPTFALLRELGIADTLRWRETSMGIFTGGKLHRWGDPIALLKFPHLSLLQKLRYALFAFVCVRRNEWPSLEHETAREWITRWCGKTVFERLWQPLFDFKFFEYAENISAAWIWTRIRRIGRSRQSIFQEELGYLEGGTETLVRALIASIQKHGGNIQLATKVNEIVVHNGAVTGVQTSRGYFPADEVLCTVPTPLVPALVPELSAAEKAKYMAINNIGCICVIFKLNRSVTPHFWVNVSEPEIEIPGVIEFTNLRHLGDDKIVYVPFYMPVTHPRFFWQDQQLLDEAFSCLRTINPDLQSSDIRAGRVHRLRHGQPICEPGFKSKLPPIQTSIAGLQIADTCFYYPEDRGIAESVRVGQEMAQAIRVEVAREISAAA